jgi:hypothetical protein
MSLYTAERARTLPAPGKFGGGTFVSDERLGYLRERIISGTLTGRQQTKWEIVRSRQPGYVPMGPVDPWYIPNNYGASPEELAERAEKLERFHTDSETAVDLALRYRLALDGEEDHPEDFAAGVARILEAWSTLEEVELSDGSQLNWNEGWGPFIQAALMISDSDAYTATVESNFKAVTEMLLHELSTAYSPYNNNWSSWGLATEIAASGFLGDRARFNGAIFRWRQQFNDSVVSGFVVDNGGVAQGETKDNVQHLEVYRQGNSQGDGSSGLLYCNHDLNGKVMAAEWARVNGVWLYDHEAADGSTLRGVYENVTYWDRYRGTAESPNREVLWFNTSEPASGFYFDLRGFFYILNALWPREDAAWAIGSRDITDDHEGIRGADLLYWDLPLYG